MTTDEKKAVREIVRSLLMLISNERDLAVTIAKNQNAPKYLPEQSANLTDHIQDLLRDL